MDEGFFSLGHNQGPPLEDEHVPEWGRDGFGTYFEWRRAHKKAWKAVPAEMALRRLMKAEEAGVRYEEYVSELLDTGRYLQKGDARVREILRGRRVRRLRAIS